MKKLTPTQAWELAKKAAKHFNSLSYSKDEIMEMDKFEMSKKLDEVSISEMPDKLSMYDGKDYDEEDTFPYFQTLVLFHYAIEQKQSAS